MLEHAEKLEKLQPEYRQDILSFAEKIKEQYYPVYHQKIAPLSTNFDWHQLKKGPKQDQLYMSRPQRFGFAPVFAQAALFDSKYIQHLDVLLSSWQCYARQCKSVGHTIVVMH